MYLVNRRCLLPWQFVFLLRVCVHNLMMVKTDLNKNTFPKHEIALKLMNIMFHINIFLLSRFILLEIRNLKLAMTVYAEIEAADY